MLSAQLSSQAGRSSEGNRLKAILVLADGTTFEGTALGAVGRAVGEVVFNTSMTGYQEILTDPSYRGQIVALTYPLIGNYGTNDEDLESREPQVRGFIVKEACDLPSNFRSAQTTEGFLKQHDVVGIQEIDVRALTRKLRHHGVLMGTITSDESRAEALARVQCAESYELHDFVREVSTPQPYLWNDDRAFFTGQPPLNLGDGPRVVVMDYGLKFNILRSLRARGCEVIALPCASTAEDVLALKPDGILLSPGPGDPALLGYAVDEVRKLIGKVPMMAICLGNQLLAYAVGGKCYKLKFGHRGANHPVKDLHTGRVYITSQNHGYAVDPDSLPSNVEVSLLNLNDGTVEGLLHKDEPVFSAQYHPEASPGPRDNAYLFDRFVAMTNHRTTEPPNHRNDA